jgi:hypothetical protein
MLERCPSMLWVKMSPTCEGGSDEDPMDGATPDSAPQGPVVDCSGLSSGSLNSGL